MGNLEGEAVMPPREKLGLLLVNLGSPDAPTKDAVRRYLAEFLWDKRMIEIPRLLWWLILHLFVLRFRPAKSAKAYKEVWREEGSPLVAVSEKIGDILRDRLNLTTDELIHVEVAMRYGTPSIGNALEKMRAIGVNRVVVLPMYPQYAAATTASVFDALVSHLAAWRTIPGFCFISDYHARMSYITAVAGSIAKYWEKNGKAEYLLFSFHGLPERSRKLGDPYFGQCHVTA
ncbi:MAG: ferrochelatase, partial [Pseudomonadota bacterium]